MMGRLNHSQGRLFYSFCLEGAIPDDHLVRKVAAVLDLSWVHAELAPHYPDNGRPSIDPELMIRMLIIGYVFAIRSERALCRDVRVNLAYRWFCGEVQNETSPPKFSASGCERCRAVGRLAHRAGARLSVAAGADHCESRARRRIRLQLTSDRRVRFAFARPTGNRGKQARCRRHDWH